MTASTSGRAGHARGTSRMDRSPRRTRLVLDDKGGRLAVRLVEAPESPTADLAAARVALRLMARWLVAQAKEAEEPSQARQNSPDMAPQPPPRKVLDFQTSKRTPVRQ